jgi:transcription antitermination factor NusG
MTLDHEVVKLKPGQEIDLSTLGFEGQKGEIKYISGNNCWVIIKSLGFVVKVTLDNS